MPFIDFREVKRNVSIHQTAQFLHLESHHLAPGWHRCWCPRCEAHTLIIAFPYGTFFCAKGRVSGDQLALYAHAKGVGVKEAAARLSEFYGATLKTAPPLSPASHSGKSEHNGGDNDRRSFKAEPRRAHQTAQ